MEQRPGEEWDDFIYRKRNDPTLKPCLNCGELRERIQLPSTGFYESWVSYNKRKYCSRDCFADHRRRRSLQDMLSSEVDKNNSLVFMLRQGKYKLIPIDDDKEL